MNAMKYGLADESSMAMTPVIRALVRNLQLVLSSHDETTDAEYRSNAPDRLDLSDYQKRMGWIKSAAMQYHRLMQTQPTFMHAELKSIQSWADTPDS